MLFDERVIQYVFTLVQEKNISKAAEKLYISQPTLSKFLNNLELKLGANIFVRGKKNLSLTPAGIKYLEYLHKVETLNKEYGPSIKAANYSSQPVIKVGCGSITSPLLTRYVFPEFKKLHPEVRLVMVEDVHTKLLPMLEEKALDVAILVGQFDEEPYLKDARCDTIVKGARLLATSLDNPLVKYIPDLEKNSIQHPYHIDPRLLDGQVLIAGMPGQKQYNDVRLIQKKYNLVNSELVSTKNVFTGISMAVCNLGAYYFPSYYFYKFAVDEPMAYFVLDIEEEKWSLVLQHSTNDVSPIMEDFVAITKEKMGV